MATKAEQTGIGELTIVSGYLNKFTNSVDLSQLRGTNLENEIIASKHYLFRLYDSLRNMYACIKMGVVVDAKCLGEVIESIDVITAELHNFSSFPLDTSRMSAERYAKASIATLEKIFEFLSAEGIDGQTLIGNNLTVYTQAQQFYQFLLSDDWNKAKKEVTHE